MRFSKNLENVFPGLSLLRLGGHDFILLLERDAIPDPYFSIPSTPGKARFTSIRNSTSLSPALFVGGLFPSSLLLLLVRTRPTLFQSTDTNSLCRFTPTFSNKCWICVRPVDRRIASCWQDSSSVLPSISKLATLGFPRAANGTLYVVGWGIPGTETVRRLISAHLVPRQLPTAMPLSVPSVGLERPVVIIYSDENVRKTL